MAKSKKINTVILPPHNAEKELSMIGLYCNISRMYEIAQVGGFNIAFAYSNVPDYSDRSVNFEDCRKLANFYNITPTLTGEIICEVCRPGVNEILDSINRRYETIEDLNARIKAAQEFPLPSLETITSNSGSESLMKTATDRLNIGPWEFDLIRKIAQVIARHALSPVIRIEHLAEAIMYRSVRPDDPTMSFYGLEPLSILREVQKYASLLPLELQEKIKQVA